MRRRHGVVLHRRAGADALGTPTTDTPGAQHPRGPREPTGAHWPGAGPHKTGGRTPTPNPLQPRARAQAREGSAESHEAWRARKKGSRATDPQDAGRSPDRPRRASPLSYAEPALGGHSGEAGCRPPLARAMTIDGTRPQARIRSLAPPTMPPGLVSPRITER